MPESMQSGTKTVVQPLGGRHLGGVAKTRSNAQGP